MSSFPLSPGVNFTEIDLTQVIPSVSTSCGALAGVFHWGPVGEVSLIPDINTYVKRYGFPTTFNAETFFAGYNFLSYAGSVDGSAGLYVSRAANTSGATPYGSFYTTANSTVSNNVFLGNTSALSTGLYVSQSSNTTVMGVGNTITITSINSTTITLSSNTNTNVAATLYFASPNVSYSAVAFDSATTGQLVANLAGQIVINENAYAALANTFDPNVMYVARYPGLHGKSLGVSVCDTAASYSSNVSLGATTIAYTIGSNVATASFTGTSNASANTVMADFSIGDQILAGNSTVGLQYLQLTAISVNTAFGANTLLSLNFNQTYRLHSNYTANTIQRYWQYFNSVGIAPGQSTFVLKNGNTAANDQLHVVVVDNYGKFSGTPGTILEVYKNVSRANDAINSDGTDNYYVDVINQSSQYVWWANDRTTAPSANAMNVVSSTSTAPMNSNFVLGSNGPNEQNIDLGTIGAAYNFFAPKASVPISLVIQGHPMWGTTVVNGQTISNYQLSNWLLENLCEIRQDCVGFVSPPLNYVLNNVGSEATSLVNFRGALDSTSYGVIDTGYKYQYDQYNDVNRWIPLNGDIAGLCARTDATNNPWWSPAGFNRGGIKNCIKLAYNPSLQADRDLLYSNGINPVVSFINQGTILYGDKTMQTQASAFDRINVRRLFIVLEKAISLAAQAFLFEFNDSFTQTQFKNIVNPYLRQIQGLRGITDYLVVCDSTNNTPAVVDANQFVGDIYIKPNYSINFIQLNFIAVPTGIAFQTIVGQY